ncbi:MAG: hypothetical protein R3C28_33395, partial [Pirellulaceae bacterium]
MSFTLFRQTEMLNRLHLILVVAAVSVAPANADHHQSFEFLKSFEGVWQATEGKDVRGTTSFSVGVSGKTLYIRGELGDSKFDDFITYDPKTKVWLIVGAGHDGSRYTHSINAFPKGKMKAGQQWDAKTIGTTADGKPTTGSLHFVAKTSDSYELTIKETVNGEAIPDRI